MDFYDIGENFSDEIQDTIELISEVLNLNDVSRIDSFCALINQAINIGIKEIDKDQFIKIIGEIWDIHKENHEEEY